MNPAACLAWRHVDDVTILRLFDLCDESFFADVVACLPTRSTPWLVEWFSVTRDFDCRWGRRSRFIVFRAELGKWLSCSCFLFVTPIYRLNEAFETSWGWRRGGGLVRVVFLPVQPLSWRTCFERPRSLSGGRGAVCFEGY